MKLTELTHPPRGISHEGLRAPTPNECASLESSCDGPSSITPSPSGSRSHSRPMRVSLVVVFSTQLLIVFAAFAIMTAMFIITHNREIDAHVRSIFETSLQAASYKATTFVLSAAAVSLDVPFTLGATDSSVAPTPEAYLRNASSAYRSQLARAWAVMRTALVTHTNLLWVYEMRQSNNWNLSISDASPLWHDWGCSLSYCYYCDGSYCFHPGGDASFFSNANQYSPLVYVTSEVEVLHIPSATEFVSAFYTTNESKSEPFTQRDYIKFAIELTPSLVTTDVLPTTSVPINVTLLGLNTNFVRPYVSDGSTEGTVEIVASLMRCLDFNLTTGNCTHAIGVDFGLKDVSAYLRSVLPPSGGSLSFVDFHENVLIASSDPSVSPLTADGQRVDALHTGSAMLNDAVARYRSRDGSFSGVMMETIGTSAVVGYQCVDVLSQRSELALVLIFISDWDYYYGESRRTTVTGIVIVVLVTIACVAVGGGTYAAVAGSVKMLITNFEKASTFRNDEVTEAVQQPQWLCGRWLQLSEMDTLLFQFGIMNNYLGVAKTLLPQSLVTCAMASSASSTNANTPQLHEGSPQPSNGDFGLDAIRSPSEFDDPTISAPTTAAEVVTAARNRWDVEPHDGDEPAPSVDALPASPTPSVSNAPPSPTTPAEQQQHQQTTFSSDTLLAVGSSSQDHGGRRKRSAVVRFTNTTNDDGSRPANPLTRLPRSTKISASLITSSSSSGDHNMAQPTWHRMICTELISSRHVVVLYGNMVGFHTICCRSGALSGLKAMQDALVTLQGVLQKTDGVMDFFHGDRVMITFNASRPSHHSQTACLETLRGFMLRFNKATLIGDHSMEKKGPPIGAMRFGVADGTALCGYYGTPTIQRFCIAGSVVNCAWALMERCRVLNVSCLFTAGFAQAWPSTIVCADTVCHQERPPVEVSPILTVVFPVDIVTLTPTSAAEWNPRAWAEPTVLCSMSLCNCGSSLANSAEDVAQRATAEVERERLVFSELVRGRPGLVIEQDGRPSAEIGRRFFPSHADRLRRAVVLPS